MIYARGVPRDLAPVVLFAYRRPDHLSEALRSLAANPGAESTRLTIYCDGPKGEADQAAVAQVRKVAHQAKGFAQVDVIERESNLGLAQSVISGVTWALEENDRVIVMEDDLVVSPDFLEYMNQALELYEDEDRVISIHGFMYAVPPGLPQSVFLRGADCWGWATWRRGWRLFEADSGKLLKQLERSPDRDQFDFGGAFPYLQMLRDQAKGRIDSWAIRWYASAFLANKLTLYPGKSLVENIGQEGSGTHSESASSHEVKPQQIELPLQMIDICESSQARKLISATLAKARNSEPLGLAQRLKNLLGGGGS